MDTTTPRTSPTSRLRRPRSAARLPVAAAVAAALLLAACGSASGSAPTTSSAAPPGPSVTSSSTTSTLSPSSPAAPSTSGGGDSSRAADVEGTVVRFTSTRTSVDVTVGPDTPAVRQFLGMLPLELSVEEFSGREKIAYLPSRLDTDGTPGSDPEEGDLIYYAPWGNLGLYYDTSGVGFSNSTLHLGTYQASEDQLAQLEGDNVRIERVG